MHNSILVLALLEKNMPKDSAQTCLILNEKLKLCVLKTKKITTDPNKSCGYFVCSYHILYYI